MTPSSASELAAAGVDIEDAPCSLCGTAGGAPVLVGKDRRHDTPGRFLVVRCGTCGLLRTNPRPTRGSIARYYPPDYAPYQDHGTRQGALSRRWFDRRVSPMPPVSPPGRLLEIGTSFGAFLDQCKRAGWDVTGIEFDERAAARAAALTGATVHAASVESVDFPAHSFDVICAWHVIEHLHDPVAVLRRLAGWLVPGGWIAIGLPDADSWAFRIFQERWYPLELPRHLYHFSPRTVSTALHACGFTDTRIVHARTIYDTLLSLAGVVEESGALRPGRANTIIDTLPLRALNAAFGLLAPATGLAGVFSVLARKPL